MREKAGKNKILIVIIICLCAVIIAGLIYFMKLKGGSDSAFKPDLDPNAKTQTADDTGIVQNVMAIMNIARIICSHIHMLNN